MFARTKKRMLVASLSLATGVTLIAGSLAMAIPAPPVNGQFARCLAQGKSCLKSGQLQKAVISLEQAVKEAPASCEAHYYLGEAYCKVKAFVKAKQQYRAAIRVGKGSVNAQKANQALMALPKSVIAPKSGPETRMLASVLGIGKHRGPGGAPKATVIDFYASWCHPCKQLDTVLEKMKAQYGDQISFMRVDVDDPENERLIDQYEVSPIPTLVFLNSEGEVVTFSVGYSGEPGVTAGIKKILSNQG